MYIYSCTSSRACVPPMATINIHDLHGCAININYVALPAPPQPIIRGTTTITEAEYDVFS